MADEASQLADLIITNANELLTISGNNSSSPRVKDGLKDIGLVKNGAVAVKNGTIIAVGTTPEVQESVEVDDNTKTLDCEAKTVMPGFIDPHTHTIFAGSRENELVLKLEGLSYLKILNQGGGILKTVNATRDADISTLIQNSKIRFDTMLAHGTTTVETKSGYGLTPGSELKLLKAAADLQIRHPIDIVSTFLGAHAIPPEYEGRPDEYIDLIITEMLPHIKDSKLAEFCDVFCEKNVFSVDQSKKLLLKAQEFGLVPKIHADELNDLGGAKLAAEVGAVSADHLEMTSQDGFNALATGNVIGVLLPGTPFTLMSDNYPQARSIIDAGVPVALATDFNPNCWVESMQFIITLACYKMKMLPSEAIVASTINAAHAVNRDQYVGSLEAGKKADIIILDVPNHIHIPYNFSTNLVETVIKNGEVVVERGK